MAVRAYEWVKRSGVRTGSVITDIAVLLLLLAWAWGLIGWRALRAAAAARLVRVPFWFVILAVWPFTWLLRLGGVLPQSNSLAGLVDSTLITSVIACLLVGQRRQRDRDQRAWSEQMAGRRQHRAPAAQAPRATRPIVAGLQDHDWLAARLDEHDWQLAEQGRKIGEFLWIAREAAARAGISVPDAMPEPDGKPNLRVVRDDAAS